MVNTDIHEDKIITLIRSKEEMTIKFTKDSAEVISGNVEKILGDNETSKKFWFGNGFMYSEKIGTLTTLTGTIGDVLAYKGYPSVVITKTLDSKKVSTYRLTSPEEEILIAEFSVKPRELPPKCFTKCYVLDKKGKYKRVTGPMFDYFHEDIIPYDQLSKIKIPSTNKLDLRRPVKTYVLTFAKGFIITETRQPIYPILYIEPDYPIIVSEDANGLLRIEYSFKTSPPLDLAEYFSLSEDGLKVDVFDLVIPFQNAPVEFLGTYSDNYEGIQEFTKYHQHIGKKYLHEKEDYVYSVSNNADKQQAGRGALSASNLFTKD